MSRPIAAAQYVLASSIESKRSHLALPLLTYVVSFHDEFKHYSLAMTNAKHPTPEDAADL